MSARQESKTERFERFKRDPTFIDAVCRMIVEYKKHPRHLAERMGVPRYALIRWLSEEQTEKFYSAMRAIGADVGLDARETIGKIGDPKKKFDAQMEYAGVLNRETFGARLKLEKEITVKVDAGLVGFASDLISRIAKRERPAIEAGQVSDAEVVSSPSTEAEPARQVRLPTKVEI